MEKIEGISGFFKHLGVEARYFDLGRRIRQIDNPVFEKSDLHNAPYPYPYLRSAWLGVVFWSSETHSSPMVWTLKFPLDETNRLHPEDRDRFLQQLLITIGTNLRAAKTGERLQAVLDNNPYSFDLPDDRRASYHAKVSALLGRPPSRFYDDTLKYFQSPDTESWKALGIQGLADVAARWKDNHSLLCQAMSVLPDPAFIGITQLLEHEMLDIKLVTAITERLKSTLSLVQNPENAVINGALIAAGIRGISLSDASYLRQQTLLKVMAVLPKPDVEVIAALASRCYEDLANEEVGLQFLELLAKLGHDNFIQVISDLMSLPEVRPHIMQAFRHTARSETLNAAIGALFNRVQQAEASLKN
ncbi:DUF3549 family protein [Marinibactrum halimedae]|uniref:DUF3549 family protein n=1 Tax=Marinibactrum halimedae TaxID=1444977 RepID=A0AA37T8Q5_9GAMM|nr:DUF3549 family protein [Marinibactrum halimedae]MCD9457990.1 DUF3549 family protein [Marinibactrum halimedae]GLS27616.1 hypothetical protein GCM10007877_33350 [Marinibactrum halimedae]